MANDEISPFYTIAITIDSIVQSQKQSPRLQPTNKKYQHHQDLTDLLSWDNTSSHCLNSVDSPLSITSHTISDDDFQRLKHLMRTIIWPINHRIRRQLWINTLTLNRVKTLKSRRHTQQTSQTPLTTASMIIDMNVNSLTTKYLQWPKFVDTNNLCFYHLNEMQGRVYLHYILSSFALHHPDVTYCPTLEPYSALLLHYHNEHEVVFLLNRLLIKNWLCGGTHLQWDAHCNVFQKLLKLHYKSAADIIDLRYTNSKVFYQEWFWWIFRHLPFSYTVKIMDCFLLEGPKILFRISLTLVHLFTKRIKHEASGNIADFCQQIPVSIDRLLSIAFRIRNFKRRTIEHLIEQEENTLRNTRHQIPTDESYQNNNGTISNQQSSLITPQQLTHVPKNSILNHQQFVTIWNWLPARLSLSQPMLVFTTEDHGFRLQTLLNKIDELEYSILIIRTTNGEIFGAFCAGLWSDRHNRTYFGFGETFLFTLLPKQIKYSWVGQQQNDNNRQNQVKREMFLFVSSEKLIVGGGNGDGLCIDQSLCEGHTAHCETFNNDPLCSQSDFSISTLEMITFDFSSS